MKTIDSKTIILLFFLLVNTFSNAGNTHDFYFRNLMVEDGLSQNMVYSVLQDKQGFLWFGTQDGLNRYDGRDVRIYKKNKHDSGSLGNNSIFSLIQHPDGTIWVGTANGIYLYDPVSDSFTKFVPSFHAEEQIDGIVRDLKIDSKGNVWFLISDKGLYSYTTEGKLQLHQNEIITAGSTGGTFRNFCFDHDRNIWVATYKKGLHKYNLSTASWQEIPIHYPEPTAADNDINSLFLLDAGNLLVGTTNHGVQKLDLRTHTRTPYLEQDDNGNTLYVRKILKDSTGRIWVGCESGVYIQYPQKNGWFHAGHDFNNPFSLSDNAIHALYEDNEQGIWLGTYFGGVSYYTDAFAQFKKHYPMSGKNSISGKSISEFCEDNNGNIWIGTEDGGLNHLDTQTGQFTNGFIPAKNIHALMYDNHRLWIGTFADGLYIYDIRTGHYTSFKSKEDANSLNSDHIYAIYKDFSGTVWIGTMFGLHIYKGNGIFEAVRPDDIRLQVNDIVEDFQGILWFATLGDGLFSYDKKIDKWKHYPFPTPSDKDRGRMVTCLLEDSNHNLWIGTEGAGFALYDRENDCFNSPVTMEEGLPNDVIYKLIEDKEGYLWGSTNKGLFRYNPTYKQTEIYTHEKGLLGDQFNYKSGLPDHTGKIYFGGVKGFVSFDPLHLAGNRPAPPVVINYFQLINKGSRPDNEVLYSSLPILPDEITLPPNSNLFTIGFAALSFVFPAGNQFAYKLEGKEKEWIYAGNINRVTYSNISPGTYLFHVKAANVDGVWNEEGAVLKIVIPPPFYRTKLAWFIYFLCCGILIYYSAMQYIRRIERKSLRSMEKLQQKKESELYHAKIEFFTNVTHEIRTPLSLIKAPLDEVMRNIDTRNEHWENLSIIQRNANRLLKLVNELLDFRKAESKGLTLNYVETDFIVLLNETITRFTPAAKLKHIAISSFFPGGEIRADIDSEVLTKIISNLLNNCLKHAKSSIHICIKTEDEHIFLSLTNDGASIPLHQQKKIFEPFYKGNNMSEGSGLGLPFAKSLIELHGGTIRLEEREDGLTTFTISFPIKQVTSIRLNQSTETDNAGLPDKLPDITPTHDKPVLLSVEDNEEFQDFMAGQLSVYYKILKAKHGAEALDILNTQHVDLVISDIMMPVMDGITLCREIKETLKFSHIPVILLTARTSIQSKMDGLKTGADEYIIKPYSIDFLLTRIDNLLQNRKKILDSYKNSPEISFDAIAHSKADQEFLEKLIEVIHSCLNEIDLDVDRLASLMHMSRATLYRKVKNISDLTPNDFIRLIRLKKAAELLHRKEYRINEIAFIVGFSSSSYFSKCFYKQFGVLPKDFDKNVSSKR